MSMDSSFTVVDMFDVDAFDERSVESSRKQLKQVKQDVDLFTNIDVLQCQGAKFEWLAAFDDQRPFNLWKWRWEMTGF